MNAFLQELCAWLDADRLGKKVLFVRNMATGNQLLRMAANHGSPAVNTVAVPVRAYINQLAEGELVKRGLQKIDSVTASIALQGIMRDLGNGTFETMGKVELTTASRMLPLRRSFPWGTYANSRRWAAVSSPVRPLRSV